MGTSGSGKSTLLYCLSGMDQPTAGSVTFLEQTIMGLKEKQMAKLRQKEFGFVLQQIHLVSNLSLYENFIVPGYLNHEESTETIKARTLELLVKVNVLEAKDRLSAQVSGGEAQRAAIARAVISVKYLFALMPI